MSDAPDVLKPTRSSLTTVCLYEQSVKRNVSNPSVRLRVTTARGALTSHSTGPKIIHGV
jgi:hypothetical protein